MGLVLEILVQGPGKSWKFLGWGSGHIDAGADSRCHNSRVNNGERFSDNLFDISQ